MQLAYKWQAAIIGALGLFMAVLDNTIVNVALPQMRIAFHTDQATIEWVVTAYFLSQAAVIPVVGYLSDRVGSKVIFLTALILFTVGSGLCAFAPNEGALIVFRVIQGIGGGALFPIVFAIIFRVFPPEERGPASAVVGVPVLLAPVFGPTIGGLLTKNFDWRAIFTINLPIGVVVTILGFIVLKNREAELAADNDLARGHQSFDIVGLLLALVGTTALVYGITESGAYGIPDLHVWPFLLSGIVLLAAFVLYELRVSDPVLDVRLFKNYTFTMVNILTWVMSAFLFGSLFLLPFYFETVQGKDPLETGLIFISQGLGSLVGVILSGRLYNRVGPRPIIVVGMILVTVATLGFVNLDVNTPSSTLQIWLVFRGLGFGLSNIPLQTFVLARISNREMARASSLVNATRQIFSAIGISALTAYLTHEAASHVASVTQTFQATQLPSVQAHCVAQFGQNTTAVQQCVQTAAQTYVFQHSFTMGLNNTFVLVILGTSVAFVLALFTGRDPNVERMKAAAARGETVRAEPMVIGE